MRKFIWISVLVVSIIVFCLLAFLPVEVFFGWDMPFVELDDKVLTIFGYEVLGYERQLGFVTLSGIMMMLPGRTIPLAIMKLMEKKRHPYYH